MDKEQYDALVKLLAGIDGKLKTIQQMTVVFVVLAGFAILMQACTALR